VNLSADVARPEFEGDLYRALVELLPDGIIIHCEGRIVFANTAAVRLFGATTAEDLYGRSPLDLVDPDHRAEVTRRIQRLDHDGGVAQLREERLITLDGRTIDVEVCAMRITFQGKTAVQAVVRDISERKRAEAERERARQALEASERKLRDIFESSPDGIAIKRASDGRYLMVNPQWERLTGFSKDDAIGKSPDQLGIWADPNTFAGILHDLDANARVLNLERELRRKDGGIVWILFSALRVDVDGVPSVLSFYREITDRKRDEQILRQNAAELERWKKRHDAVVRASGQILYSWNVRTNTIAWTGNYKDVLGYDSLPEKLEPALSLVIHPEDRQHFEQQIARSCRAHEPLHMTYRVRCADGSYRFIEDHGYFVDGDDGGDEMVGFMIDVTERKRAEQTLRESEERFRQLTDNISDVFWMSNTDLTKVLYLSPAFESVWGISAESVYRAPRSFVDLVVPEDRPTVFAALSRVTAGQPAVTEFRIRRRDGAVRWLWIRTFPIRNAAGELYRTAGLTTDVTERKLLEQELRAARDKAIEADRLKGAFLANMSHEIRTPLNVIMGFQSLIAEHLVEANDHSQDEYFDRIHRASRRLLNTIQGILDLAKIEVTAFEIQPKRIELRSLVREQLEEFEPIAKAKGISLVSRIEAHAEIRFDEYCLTHALANLLDNAIKFTAEGEVVVRLYRTVEAGLVLEVADTGVGIDAAYIPRLFDAFSQEDTGYTRSFDGSGLGLALVRKYVEMNGARVTVTSQKGRGSVFRIQFAPDAVADASAIAPREAHG
jgi:PAS domain S-box-containing protein